MLFRSFSTALNAVVNPDNVNASVRLYIYTVYIYIYIYIYAVLTVI